MSSGLFIRILKESLSLSSLQKSTETTKVFKENNTILKIKECSKHNPRLKLMKRDWIIKRLHPLPLHHKFQNFIVIQKSNLKPHETKSYMAHMLIDFCANMEKAKAVRWVGVKASYNKTKVVFQSRINFTKLYGA